MKRFLKSLLGLIITLIILGTVFCIIDTSLVKEAKTPVFSIKKNEKNITDGAKYIGLGYKLYTYKNKHDMIVKKGLWFTDFKEDEKEYDKIIKEKEDTKEELNNAREEKEKKLEEEKPTEKTEEEKLNEIVSEKTDEIRNIDGKVDVFANFEKLLDKISKKENYKLKIYDILNSKEKLKFIKYENNKIEIIEKNEEGIAKTLEKENPEIKQKEENEKIIYFIHENDYDFDILKINKE